VPEYTDIELLAMFRKCEQKHYAFNLLVKKYQKKIYLFARRMVIIHEDADDIVQNVFIKVWNNLDGFREDAQFFTWLYRIAVNESLSFLKSKQLRTFLSFSSPEALALNSIRDDNFFNGDEIQTRLRQAIIKLPKKQQLVFNMRYFDEMSYEEMSNVLGTSVGALKASYHFAAKKIEEFIMSN